MVMNQTMGRPTAQGIAVEFPISGQELAEMIATTPYTVSRILAGWRRLGVVDAQRDQILILQPQRLAAIAGEPGRAEVSDPAEGSSPRSRGTGNLPPSLRVRRHKTSGRRGQTRALMPLTGSHAFLSSPE